MSELDIWLNAQMKRKWEVLDEYVKSKPPCKICGFPCTLDPNKCIILCRNDSDEYWLQHIECTKGI